MAETIKNLWLILTKMILLFCEKKRKSTMTDFTTDFYEKIKEKGFTDNIEYFKWRRKMIYEQRESGRTFKSIGEEHGITGARAGEVYKQALWWK